ncbi:hypothetical protein ANCDUO_06871 [Ancylostoma duodenale]|uniref:Uncharacterized protein n=1 Tax=Ancylostoma duodenale TaxID=51022 RepID=A0A0C2GV02_9BILA|nr:hypothetical protein ANCDUO_06871 [Ancylostoma duodenale]
MFITIKGQQSVGVILQVVANEQDPVKSTAISTEERSGYGPHVRKQMKGPTQSAKEIHEKHQSTEYKRSQEIVEPFNIFSNFVKSGMEAYVLGESRMNGQSGEKHEIIGTRVACGLGPKNGKGGDR